MEILKNTVILDLGRYQELEQKESFYLKYMETKIKRLEKELEAIKEGKVAGISFRVDYYLDKIFDFYHPENVKEVAEIKEIYDKNKKLKDENYRLKTRTLWKCFLERLKSY